MDSTCRSGKTLLRVAAIALVLAACGVSESMSPASSTIISPRPSAGPSGDLLIELVAAATEEAALTTIGLSPDACNYGTAIERFTSKYGIVVTELEPDARPEDQVATLTAATVGDPAAPDVIDVTLPWGSEARTNGLLQPFRVSTWDTIPETAKDSEGYWWGGYFGVLAFEVNTAVALDIPGDWTELLKPEYRGHIALAGDPRESSEAVAAVYAAAMALGGSLDDASPGLAFFRQLRESGNLLPEVATSTMIASGQVPIGIRWSYNALSNRAATLAAGGPEIAVIVPPSGRLANLHVQGISAKAAHPNAARLWQEFLLSDEGQRLWLDDFCYPVRFDDLAERGVLEPEQSLSVFAGTAVPSPEELAAATEVIRGGWGEVVGLTAR